MRAHRHHATPRCALGIKRVELPLEIVRIHGRAEVPGFIIHNAIHAGWAGDDSKWFVPHIYQKRFVAAYVVNVVDEAERLKDSKGLKRARNQKGLKPTGRVPVARSMVSMLC
jgi:hypothetical protein